MHRSVYSIVLSDDVVREVDKLAYSLKTSRSALINQILADYVSYSTPEQRMRDVFSQMEQMLHGLDSFQFLNQPSDSMVSIRSALRYKYNPTIRYSVELYRGSFPLIGALKVSFRTQNQQLIQSLHSFFSVWMAVENKYAASAFPQGRVPCGVEDGRYTREFLLPSGETEEPSSESIAQAISQYIRLFDASLKTYFSHLDAPQEALPSIESSYRKARSQGLAKI